MRQQHQTIFFKYLLPPKWVNDIKKNFYYYLLLSTRDNGCVCPNLLTNYPTKLHTKNYVHKYYSWTYNLSGSVKDDSGNLSFDNKAKKVAWKQHYEWLLNEVFSWNPEDLTADPVVGPPIHIDVEMVVKAITKMKTGKAAGPSGIVAEMLKASGDTGARLVADLANDMVRNGVIPSDWEDSFIINIYKGKGDALERGNYRGLKLLDHVMKGIEERISIDDMQFGFMPGSGTTDAIFILRQLQEKHLAKNKKLYFAFVDLEKAFDRVPRKVIWWAMRKLGIEEWIVRFVQAMYNNTRSRVRVNNTYSDEFGVKVGVHQGSVLRRWQ